MAQRIYKAREYSTEAKRDIAASLLNTARQALSTSEAALAREIATPATAEQLENMSHTSDSLMAGLMANVVRDSAVLAINEANFAAATA